MEKPTTLTVEHCEAVLPTLEIAPEWQRKHDAGELPEGLAGFAGMLQTTWPEERFAVQEARYVLWLYEQGTIRWLAQELTGDGNQVIGGFLIEAAQRVVETKCSRVNCRWCAECVDRSHHWTPEPQEDPTLPEYGCKHCPQRGRECDVCAGEGCETCAHEGVLPAAGKEAAQ